MPKVLSTIIFLCLLSLNLFSKGKTFHINGTVQGKQIFKYAVLFNNGHNMIEKKAITGGSFKFSGSYESEQPSGEITFGIVVLTNIDSITDKSLLSIEKNYSRLVILEHEVNLTYNSDQKYFLVKGAALNDVNNLFKENEDNLQRKRDSINQFIKDKNLSHSARQQALKSHDSTRLELVRKHPDSEAALFNFFSVVISPKVPLDQSRAVYESLSPQLKTSKYGQRIDKLFAEQVEWQKVQLTSKLKIGDQMPEFVLQDTKSQMTKGKDKFTRYTLIDFWASWCIPCRRDIPHIKAAFEKYGPKGFSVIAISVDAEKDRAKWLTAINQDGSTMFTHLFNPQGTPGIAKELNINAIPANFLVDANGKVIAINMRGNDLEIKLKALTAADPD